MIKVALKIVRRDKYYFINCVEKIAKQLGKNNVNFYFMPNIDINSNESQKVKSSMQYICIGE
jgi:hypothetical protein